MIFSSYGFFRDNETNRTKYVLESKPVGGEPVAIYKGGRGFQLRSTEKKSSKRPGQNPSSGLSNHCSNCSTKWGDTIT